MKRVLFLCIGNSCRSQMAEGFARKYGSDVMEVQSAGLAPAPIVQPQTKKVMLDKNIDIADQWAKDLGSIALQQYDLLVNMSGARLPTRLSIEVREWKVEDPIGCTEEVYLQVRDQIENLVMQLILELRRDARREEKRLAPSPPPRRTPAHPPAPAAADSPTPTPPDGPVRRRFMRTVRPR